MNCTVHGTFFASVYVMKTSSKMFLLPRIAKLTTHDTTKNLESFLILTTDQKSGDEDEMQTQKYDELNSSLEGDSRFCGTAQDDYLKKPVQGCFEIKFWFCLRYSK